MKNNRPRPYKSRSYNEILKSMHNRSLKKEENEKGKYRNKTLSIVDTYMESVLEKALLNRKLELLEIKIDAALDAKDKALFLELSAQYEKLKQQ
ncbi:IDEAL domain-containing protein [Fictibacillus sp. NRS-1165]|uniref:IDEAL domain-containing protein n=1 Tax=Fictibacillus sp. NRS-1165 TaxID=3144463 RepID=UPI003D20EC3A